MPEAKLTHLQIDVDDNGIALVKFDAPGEKMNTLSPDAKQDILALIDRLENDTEIKGVVLASAKPDNFIAGADINVLETINTASEATRLARDMQKVLERLERLHTERSKPVVAAIHGACMGGGLEVALACSMRIVSDHPKTILSFPEVKLGLFPGAGGTQRAPRLIGITKALDMILTGKNVRPKKAVKIGLADELVPHALLVDIAKRRALETVRGERDRPIRGLKRLQKLAEDLADTEYLQQLALEENPVGQRVLFKKAREKLIENTRGNYPGPEKALEVVRIGIQEGLEAGYAAEADRFGQLVVSPEAESLISIFFGMQDLKKENGTDDPKVKARGVKKVGVLGGGLMGGGIATVTVDKAGIPARIKELDDAGVARGLGYVHKVLRKAQKRRHKSAAEVERLMHQVTGSIDFTGFKSADVIIEAVFEDLGLKQKMLQQVEELGRDDIIFASNTSSLPISDIAKASKHPETVIGMHYFSPVEKMPLLEIIVTDDTADWVTATCVELGKKQGKTVIVVRDGTGFYTSRILAPFVNEAAWVIWEGGDIGQLDEAMMDWGFPVGPVTLLDEVGIDVAAKVAKIMEEAFGSRLEAPGTMEKLMEDNRKGRKNARGFYKYDENGKKGAVDDSIYAVFGQSTDRKQLPVSEIQERLGLQMINEAARCLEEGILRSARDGDMGSIFGLGFPPFRGGPFMYVDRVRADAVVKKLEGFAERFGDRFAPAQILVDHAKAGKRFRG